ncbi:MAG: GGDEF domain-containing protein [Proteobacteria bacterium]|nr:GGDEF domain-containing protein [Pseudomonadota bacterium]MBU1612517.1 GGDEF domain-containing protein [Pseudomonadota bacterium]
MTEKDKSLEEFRSLLEHFGVADDLDWLSVVLFARNLVAHLTIYDENQKTEIQRVILREIAKNKLTKETFLQIVDQIESFMLQNKASLELQNALDNEKRSTVTLVDEMNSLFAALRGSNKRQEQTINRFGQQTVAAVESDQNKTNIIKQVRGMLTELVTEFKEEARNWEEKARNLERTANFDPLLTDLYNRRSFDSYLDDTVVESQSRHTPLSLLMIDVDHFKQVNDTHGHQVGDDLLRALAKLIHSHAASFEGYPARFGGEELVIVCPMGADRSIFEAESIRQDVEGYEFLSRKGGKIIGVPIHFTISIGVAQLEEGWDADRLVEAADTALYTAKKSGRNIVSRYDFGPRTTREGNTDS